MATEGDEAASGPAHPAEEILVVESDALLALYAEGVLAGRGLGTALARDEAAGVALLAGRPAGFVAAVVDLPLSPASPGQQAVRRLRALCPGLPVVVTSAFGPDAPEADLRGLGGPTIRLHKPFRPDDLLAALDDVMASEALRLSRRHRRRDDQRFVQAEPSPSR